MLIEQTVKEYLDTVFAEDGVPVYLETPKTLPKKYIVFTLVDRGKDNHINEATLEFMSYADSKYEAALLDEKLREAMEEIVTYPDITCHLGGGNDNPDNTLKKYRYRSYFNLYY